MPRAYSAYTDVAGCKLWIDCLSGVTLSGSNAIALADQSGAGLFSGMSVAAAVANGLASAVAPVYSDSDSNFGGKPSLTWAAGTTHTALDTPTVSAQGGTWTFLAALRPTGTQATNSSCAVLDGLGGAAAVNRYIISAPGPAANVNVSTDGFTNVGPSVAKISTIPGIANATPHILAVSVSGGGSTGALVIYLDGVVVCRASLANPASPKTLLGLRLGHASNNAVTANFVGQLNALVAWNAVLSEGDVILMSRLMAFLQGVSLAGRVAS